MINVQSSTMDTKQVSLAAAIEASSQMLPLMLVFK
jgi:hypothetical protein